MLPGYPHVQVLVAFSGGLDSSALLGALARGTPLKSLRAVHVNHGLHPDAERWARHCRRIARSLNAPLSVHRAQVQRATGVSLEEVARRARYAILARELRPGELLFTAHQQDDQLETVLLQLLRGAGLRGLSAMPECAPFGCGLLVRPLLSRPRAELEAWLREAPLPFLEDPLNEEQQFDRNYLRKAVLPLVRARWPAAGSAVSRSARHAAEAQRLLDELARADVERAADGGDLAVATLRSLPLARRRNALRHWISRCGVRVPDADRLEQLAGPVLDAREDAKPAVSWPGAYVRRHAGRLSLLAPDALAPDANGGACAPAQIQWQWREQPALRLPGNRGVLELHHDPHGPIALDRLPAQLTVRWRSGGERLRLAAGGRHRSLKKLLQEAAIAVELRERMPLLFAGEQLLAAGPWWIDASIRAGDGSSRAAGPPLHAGEGDPQAGTGRSSRLPPRGRLRWRR